MSVLPRPLFRVVLRARLGVICWHSCLFFDTIPSHRFFPSPPLLTIRKSPRLAVRKPPRLTIHLHPLFSSPSSALATWSHAGNVVLVSSVVKTTLNFLSPRRRLCSLAPHTAVCCYFLLCLLLCFVHLLPLYPLYTLHTNYCLLPSLNTPTSTTHTYVRRRANASSRPPTASMLSAMLWVGGINTTRLTLHSDPSASHEWQSGSPWLQVPL
jgi:hypothetical protein